MCGVTDFFFLGRFTGTVTFLETVRNGMRESGLGQVTLLDWVYRINRVVVK